MNRVLAVITAGLLVSVLAGCGGTAQSEQSPPATASASNAAVASAVARASTGPIGSTSAKPAVSTAIGAKPSGLSKIRIMAIPAPSFASWPYELAQARGWFADQGLDPEITFNFAQVQALLGGSADVHSNGADELVIADAKGADIVVVDVMSAKAMQFMIGSKDMKDLKQIEGKNVGITSLAASDTTIQKQLFKNKGVDGSKVTFRPVGGSSQRFAALEAGQIQATILDPSLAQRAVDEGFPILATPPDFGAWPWNVIAVRRDWGQANRPLVEGLLKVLTKAETYLDNPSNDDAAVKDLAPANKMEPTAFATVLQFVRRQNLKLYEDARPSAASLEPTVTYGKDSGAIKGDVDTSKMLDTSYYDASH